MMRFKNWLTNDEFMEMSGIQNMPTDDTHLEPTGKWDGAEEHHAKERCTQEILNTETPFENFEKNLEDCIKQRKENFEKRVGYYSNFQHKDDDFTVKFNRYRRYYNGEIIPGFFEIVFKGPSGYETTNKAGTDAVTIYTKMLLAIKKLMETQEVNGFEFTPAEPKMALIYKKFYDKFLKDTFVKINSAEIIRKSWLDKTISPKDREDFDQKVKNTEYETNKSIEKIRQNKIKERQAKILDARMKYKLLKTTDGHNIFIQEIKSEYGEITAIGFSDKNAQYIELPIENITQNPTDIEAGHKLLTKAIMDGQIVVTPQNRQAMEILKKQYNITINF